jgi:hypothetical protein
MKTVLIDDMRSDIRALAVDLRQVLAALGDRAVASEWRVQDVWATGDSAEVLGSFDGSLAISGDRLRELADGAHQVIDGVFTGVDAGCSDPWVIIEAVDSSYYLVRSDDVVVLEAVRSAFRSVRDYEPQVT